MNEKCKYCDYVSKCSRICEYNSILCKIQRSFPKVVDKSYEQLKQENEHLDEVNCKLRRTNEQLKDNWNKLNEFLKSTRKENLEWDKKHNCEWQGYNAYSELLIKMQEIEQGSDSNVED